ncbi:carboxypeptidase-like regulatory domain-containing protein [Chitinophaga ginsengisoli]|uniref:Carboxypeptidase-like protein n=1 Tax=Chitinophaga ginsengisoli TaxID=363837 RepID=A0A2P8GPM8_9BACT|nr:carboxypeptidase-like regulatory domain-containing protein [Chitinophaga ginsengisoli]PSL35921.1 carboxypeptidase-like protein [Chitinophaga ginsengisoli]
MNQQASFIISIPTPCHESWNEMSPVDKGRFCQSCQKTVTDFSGMSDQQIISLLKNRQGEVCGRFHTEQLNRELRLPAYTKKHPFAPVAAMVAALTIAIPSVQAKNNVEKIQLASDGLNAIPQQTDTLPHIRGIVIDSTDKAALPAATILLEGRKIHTYTDIYGRFDLQLPQNYKEKTVKLKVLYIGYFTKEFVIPLTNGISYAEFSMQRDTRTMEAVMVGAVTTIQAPSTTSKPNAWQRFKYKVGHLFQ